MAAGGGEHCRASLLSPLRAHALHHIQVASLLPHHHIHLHRLIITIIITNQPTDTQSPFSHSIPHTYRSSPSPSSSTHHHPHHDSWLINPQTPFNGCQQRSLRFSEVWEKLPNKCLKMLNWCRKWILIWFSSLFFRSSPAYTELEERMELLEVRKWKWSNQLYDVDGDDGDLYIIGAVCLSVGLSQKWLFCHFSQKCL